MFAFLGIDSDHVTGVIVNGLAVLGGFLAGYLVFGIITWFVDKRLTGGNAPEGLKKVVKIVGGLIVALIVALILFNSGGTGTGGDKNGGGPTPQPGNGDQPGTGTNPPTPADKPTPIEDPAITKGANTNVENITVTVLTGADEAVSEKKYYRVELDGKTATYDLDGLFVELKKRHKPAENKVVRITPKYLANGGEDTIAAIQLINRGRLENIFVATSKDKK